jgi:hypothetical protein
MNMKFSVKRHAMKFYWALEVQLHAFLNSAVDEAKWSASRPSRFHPRKIAPIIYWKTMLDVTQSRSGCGSIGKMSLP